MRDQAKQNKVPLPRWLIEKPEIPLGLEFYYRAFVDLSTCRVVGMSEGRIPWTAVNDYSIRNSLSDQDALDLWEVVAKLDMVYLEMRAAKTKVDQSRNTGIGAKTETSKRRGR